MMGPRDAPETGPRVSVIVTCYDLGRFLDEAIGSVLAQTFQDFEILVVDDGSTEPETTALLADYRRPKTRVLHSANRGLPGARNLGASNTTAPYICMLDADDKLEPTYLEKTVAMLEADTSLAFVSTWLKTFGDEAWEWTPERCDLLSLLDTNVVNGAALVRREAFLAVGGLDESMRHGCEDWSLWLEMVARGFNGAIIHEMLFLYRRRSDSMSRVMMRDEVYFENFRTLIQKHPESYRRYVGDLVLRREERIGSLMSAVHDLEREHASWLTPALATRREKFHALDAKAARRARERDRESTLARLAEQLEQVERERAVERSQLVGRLEEMERDRHAERHQLLARLEEMDRDRQAERARVASLAGKLHTDRQRIVQLDAARTDALCRVQALHASMSWRLTAPLRVAYRWCYRLLGRQV